MKKINRGMIIAVSILVIVLLGFVIGLWCYEKSFTESIKEYSSFYGFLVMVVVALITFFYFLATRELAEYSAKSVKTAEDLKEMTENSEKDKQTNKLIREWFDNARLLTSKRKGYRLELHSTDGKISVSHSGKQEALVYIDDFKMFMAYFKSVKNQIIDNKINEEYYFRILSKDIISNYKNEYNTNKRVFEILVEARFQESSKDIYRDFEDIYEKAIRYLDKT